jgi:perosamine synthetase
MKKQIPFFKISWGKEDISMVRKTIERGMHWSAGPNVKRFENLLARYTGTRYAAVFNSGTSSLLAALFAHDIGSGDEVIVPSFSFISVAMVPLFLGAEPVFVDIEDETLGIDPQEIESKITRKTRAIIMAHYGGCPSKIAAIKKIAGKHSLLLIEDAAEAFGLEISSTKAGAFGDCGIFSFCQNKAITTGDGGCVVTNSKEVFDKLNLIRSYGQADNNHFYHDYISLGLNLRMSDITAALGIAQMRKLKSNIRKRRAVAGRLNEALGKISGVKLPEMLSNKANIFLFYSICVKAAIRDRFLKYLYKHGITAKIYHYPAHLSTFVKNRFGHKDWNLPVTERVWKEILSLPIYSDMGKEEIDYILSSIKRFFTHSCPNIDNHS